MEDKVENKGQRKRGEIQHTKHQAHSQRDVFLDCTGDKRKLHNVLLLFLGLNKQKLITVEHIALINIVCKCTL